MKAPQFQATGSDDSSLISMKIYSALRGLKFGSVEITVHEGRIVQIERKEKQRLNLNLIELDNTTPFSKPVA